MLKDRLGLERHNACALHGVCARIAANSLALAAGVGLNHYLGRPTRAFRSPRHLSEAKRPPGPNQGKPDQNQSVDDVVIHKDDARGWQGRAPRQ